MTVNQHNIVLNRNSVFVSDPSVPALALTGYFPSLTVFFKQWRKNLKAVRHFDRLQFPPLTTRWKRIPGGLQNYFDLCSFKYNFKRKYKQKLHKRKLPSVSGISWRFKKGFQSRESTAFFSTFLDCIFYDKSALLLYSKCLRKKVLSPLGCILLYNFAFYA